MKPGAVRWLILVLGSTVVAAESLLTPTINQPLAPHELGWQWSARPLVAVGVSTVGSYHRGDGIPWGFSAIAGMRTLFGPDSEHRVGLETSWLATGLQAEDGLRNAALVGPVAEMRVWRMVFLDAGVLYTHEFGGEQRRYADVMYGFGFAPSLLGEHSAWTPSLSYRGDLIFATHPITVRTVMVGLHYRF